jgi:GntR family transcriptional regulator
MEFSKNQPIYLQIADLICEKILLKTWNEGERIPSVREFAITIQVNPNTVMRTYSFLQEEGIITNQRGIGFFVSDRGYKSAKTFVTKQVIETDMQNLFKKMELLGISIEELNLHYQQSRDKMSGEKNENN